MTSTDNRLQRLLDCLRQWAAADRDQDQDELENARQERDEILEEHTDPPEYDGPRCQKCHEPVGCENSSQTGRGWICDDCASACEREWEARAGQ